MNHSDKAKKTMELMNTASEDWALTKIKWVKEKRMVRVKVDCPDCYGRGRTNILPDGSKFVSKLDKYSFETKKEKKALGVVYGKCPSCPSSRD